jgi:hypothetical protein
VKKNYNKYTSFLDRFPYIIFVAVIAFAIIIFLIFKARFTFPIFSGLPSTQQTQSTTSQTQQYSMLISSPANGQVYSFANQNDIVPIKVGLKADIGSTNYKLNLALGDGSIIKAFTSSPYTYNYNPGIAGDYSIVATLVDPVGNIISSSNLVKFTVEYTSGTSNTSSSETSGSTTTTTTVDNSVTINLQVSEGPVYSPGEDIYYYRVRAVVTGDPAPTVSFSKDDSNKVWGPTVAQVNLHKGQTYTLMAIASNSFDSKNASITLIAPAS